ncbi:MAG: ribonuclease P protein component [Chitinophagaceae bacterium]|nr:MAG: ribonuclease P protein component [Chitinophagaceae bacterium]
MPHRFRFPKAERLKSRKQIDKLFAGGKAFSVFPVRTIYQFTAAEKGSLQAGVTASKKHFKKAVDRNRVKRLLREAYRLQKEELYLQVNTSKKAVSLFFIYTDKTIADFDTIKTAMAKSLQRLNKLLQSEDPS